MHEHEGRSNPPFYLVGGRCGCEYNFRKDLVFCGEQERMVTDEEDLEYHAGPGEWPRDCPCAVDVDEEHGVRGAKVSFDESIGRYAVEAKGDSGMWLLLTGSGEVVGTELTWRTLEACRTWAKREAAWQRKDAWHKDREFRIVRITRPSSAYREFEEVERV